MKKALCITFVILVLSLCGCQPAGKEENQPPANAETESQAPEESIPSTEEGIEAESETVPSFSYDRLPEESTKDYFARVIEYEKEGLLAELEAERESDTQFEREKKWNSSIFESDYPLYNYENSESSPYAWGDVSPADDRPVVFYDNDYVGVGLVQTARPSVAQYAPYDFCIHGRIILDGKQLRLQVVDSYWGELITGEIVPLPHISYKDAENHWQENTEWVFMGTVDGNGIRSSNANSVYQVNAGYVTSVSIYNDFIQYDGLTPEELALTVLRIQTKYGQK